MKSLESLPRELRYQVLGLVFEPAIPADVEFTSSLRDTSGATMATTDSNR